MAELEKQIVALKQQGLQATKDQKQSQELLMACFSDQVYWKTLSDEEKRDIYRALVSRVVIREGKVERVELKV